MSRVFLAGAVIVSLGVSAVQAATLDISIAAQGAPTYNNMVRDAKLRGDGIPDWNLGSLSGDNNRLYPNFNADGTTPNSFGRQNTHLQRFDVSSIPSGSIINSATLTVVFGNAGNAAPNNRLHTGFKLSRVLPANNWVEFVAGGNGPHTDGSVTWNNRITHPTTPTPWGVSGARGAADIDSAFKLFDIQGVQGQNTTVVLNITDFVQFWVSNPGSNQGMLYYAGSNNPGDDRAFRIGVKEDGLGGTGIGAAPSLVIDYTIGGSPVAPIITEVTPDPDSVFAGSQYSKQLTLSQGTNPITWSVLAGSPPGTTVSGSGLVSGWTPTNGNIGSSFPINIRAQNAQGSDDETWQVTVQGVPPVIAEVTPDPDAASVGTPYSKQLTLTQGTLPVTWSKVQGPASASIDSNGLVSGWTPSVSDLGPPITFEFKAQNPYGNDTETWNVQVSITNNGFSTNSVFVVRSPNNGGQIREFDKITGTILTAAFLPDGSNWQSITFSGSGTGNDARMFIARPDVAGTDVEIAEIDQNAATINSANLSTIIGSAVGSAVSLGNIRYSKTSGTLFIAVNPNYNAVTTATAYEIDLGLTTRLHTWLGGTLPADVGPSAGRLYQGVRAAVGINSRDGTLYMTGWHMSQASANGLGDVIAFNTAGRVVGGTTSSFSVLIHGASYNAGNPDYQYPNSPIFRRKANGDDTLEIPTNNGSATPTPVLEFHLNTTLHPPDGNGNLILRGTQINLRHGWNGQQDIATGDVWLGAVLFSDEAAGAPFHVIRNDDTTNSYETNSRQWLDAAVPPYQACHEPFADADGDTDVDLDDFAIVQLCFTGTGGGVPGGCGCFDRLNDGDIDTADFNAFTDCATGSKIPWSMLLTPNCNP